MKKRVSPALIGSFVVGAITLVIVLVALLGSGRLFRKTYPFVLFFEGDVNGLKVGAPVKFKGVEIGSVTDIRLQLGEPADKEGEAGTARIPVIIHLDETRIREKGGVVRLGDPTWIGREIEAGLRGQLSMESFLTGLLYVKLDLLPATPVKLVGDPTIRYPEIPTVPTPLEEAQAVASKFLQKLDQVDFAGLMKSISNVAKGLDSLVNAPELKRAVTSLNKAILNLNETITSFRNVADQLNDNIAPIRQSLQTAVDDADKAIKEATMAITSLNTNLQPDSPFMYQFRTAMENLSSAARTVQSLADYLERNPSSLLRGKSERERKR
jgi:paraquat-inducible protein B